MGVFDYILDKIYCPYCGKKQDGFQTKSFDCIMGALTLKEIREKLISQAKKEKRYVEANIHTVCEKCVKLVIIIMSQSYYPGLKNRKLTK